MSSCGADLSSTSWPGSRPRAWAPRAEMHVQMKCANVMAAIAFFSHARPWPPEDLLGHAALAADGWRCTL
jgi:hypothetical protein